MAVSMEPPRASEIGLHPRLHSRSASRKIKYFEAQFVSPGRASRLILTAGLCHSEDDATLARWLTVDGKFSAFMQRFSTQTFTRSYAHSHTDGGVSHGG